MKNIPKIVFAATILVLLGACSTFETSNDRQPFQQIYESTKRQYLINLDLYRIELFNEGSVSRAQLKDSFISQKWLSNVNSWQEELERLFLGYIETELEAVEGNLGGLSEKLGKQDFDCVSILATPTRKELVMCKGVSRHMHGLWDRDFSAYDETQNWRVNSYEWTVLAYEDKPNKPRLHTSIRPFAHFEFREMLHKDALMPEFLRAPDLGTPLTIKE